MRTQTTLLGAVHALYEDHMALVAALVFATTILFPLSELLMMIYLLVPMAQHRMPWASTASCAASARRGHGA